MSYDVRNSFRLKEGVDLWTWMRRTRRKAVDNARKALTAAFLEEYRGLWYGDFGKKLEETQPDIVKRRNDIRYEAMKLMRSEYRKQAGSSERNAHHFDASFTVREYQGRFYIRAHSDMAMRDVFNFMRRDRDLENFEYWNDSDRPSSMSARRWNERRKIWDAIGNTPHEPNRKKGYDSWDDYFVVDVMSVHGYAKLAPNNGFYDVPKKDPEPYPEASPEFVKMIENIVARHREEHLRQHTLQPGQR